MAANVKLIPQLKFRYATPTGPLVAGKVYTYITGTNTPLATYSDAAGNTLNTNPIILDASGEADINLITGRGYRISVYSADDVLQEVTDGVYGASPVASDSWLNLQSFGATGDGVTDDTAAIQAACDAAITQGLTLYAPAPSVYYRMESGVELGGRLAMVCDGMDNTEFRYVPTTGSAFSWTADGSYSYFKGMKLTGSSRNLGETAVGFTSYTGGACVFYVWEQCWIEGFSMWAIDLSDSFCCAVRDSRIRRNGVVASLAGFGLDGQGGGIRLSRVTFTGAASTGNDYTNNYITGNNYGIQVEPTGSNNKALNTRLDLCFFEENWIGVDLRNLGSGTPSRYCFLNTCYGEANIYAMAMLDEGSITSCYQNDTTAGTGIPPSPSTNGPDGIVFTARYLEDKPSRFSVGNKDADNGNTTAFSIDKTAATNYVNYARFGPSAALLLGAAADADTEMVSINKGSGSPEASLSAQTGSIYMRHNGTELGNTLYIKVTGDGTNTGWQPLGPRYGSTASRPTSNAVTKGLQYYDTDILRVVTANGSGAYREYNGLSTVTDTLANIPSGQEGARFYATDIDALLVSDGSLWRYIWKLPTFVSATNGGTTAFTARGGTIINSSTATLATHTVVLPSGSDAVSGDRARFVSSGIITALTVSAGAATVVNAATTMTAGSSIEYIYNSGATSWYRAQ